jgi:hypothetical protein
VTRVLLGLVVLVILTGPSVSCSPEPIPPVTEQFLWPPGSNAISSILTAETVVSIPVQPRLGPGPWSWVIIALALAAGAILLTRRVWIRRLQATGAGETCNIYPEPQAQEGRDWKSTLRQIFRRKKKPSSDFFEDEEDPFYY